MKSNFRFNLGIALKTQYKKYGGSFPALARAIEKKVGGHIDRRKIKRLADLDLTTPVTIEELAWLDEFLRTENDGHAGIPIFTRKENLLDAVTITSKRVCFFLGAAYDGVRETVSRYDLKGVESLLNTPLNAMSVQLEDVLMTLNCGEVKEDYWNIKRDNWKTQLAGLESVIVFGSPVANEACEYILADIFSVEACQPELANSGILPFYLECPKEGKGIRSSFIVITEGALKKESSPESGGVSRVKGPTGLMLLGERYENEERWDKGEEGYEYGVLIAQRRKGSGHVSIVLCGSHGPSTLELSAILAIGDIDKNLPEINPDQNIKEPVLVSVIKVEVEYPGVSSDRKPIAENMDGDRDLRKVKGHDVVMPPRLLRFKNDEKKWLWEK